MTSSQWQRQKKLERRAAKRKQRRKELQREKSGGVAERLGRAASCPVFQCGTTQALWDNGISNVFISRKISDAKVAFAMFLVDTYCLGVKDAFGLRKQRASIFEPDSKSHSAPPEATVGRPSSGLDG